VPTCPQICPKGLHTRHGILLAPISADAIAAEILGNPQPVDLAPFSPALLREIASRRA
jgi:glycine/D-amino acid oxidase-like deaminating enzyme